ncbi:hypothetical protein LCGC14_0513640 [marine sediment metagenome]|uniref:Uncharacterized protein n=1 Tax=marine sediment metagenome TaxID=412755 RepID=A0A0F9SIU3_9ZZZZ
MEERTSIIEVGDEQWNSAGAPCIVKTLEGCKFGLMASVEFAVAPCSIAWGFIPNELPPPDEIIRPWHGWDAKGYMTLANGHRLGVVRFGHSDPRQGHLEEYFAEWERTIEAMKAEEGVMQSRPTEIRLN